MVICPDSKSNKIIILLFFLVEVGNNGPIFGEAEKNVFSKIKGQ